VVETNFLTDKMAVVAV